MEDINRNPFLISVFKFIIPGLFLSEEKLNKTKKKKLTPFEMEVEKRKKQFEDQKKEEVSFINSLITFIKYNELDYDFPKKHTYTYYKTITEEHKEIKRREDRNREFGKSKDVSNIANKI